jgi:hypothetical protein
MTDGATGATNALHCAPNPSIHRFDCVPYPVINDVVVTSDGLVVIVAPSHNDVRDDPAPNTIDSGRTSVIGVA